jgi:hypothetical protein
LLHLINETLESFEPNRPAKLESAKSAAAGAAKTTGLGFGKMRNTNDYLGITETKLEVKGFVAFVQIKELACIEDRTPVARNELVNPKIIFAINRSAGAARNLKRTFNHGHFTLTRGFMLGDE